MGSTHAGHTAADKWPLMPRGGYQRAVPRDALTGEPIRSDTIHKRVRPDPRDQRRRIARTPRTQTRPTVAISHEPLPVLQLDDLAARDAADAQEGDGAADVEGQVADGE
jgi:hypothetical protein